MTPTFVWDFDSLAPKEPVLDLKWGPMGSFFVLNTFFDIKAGMWNFHFFLNLKKNNVTAFFLTPKMTKMTNFCWLSLKMAQKLAKIKAVKIPMTLRSVMRHETFGALQFFLASDPKKPLWGKLAVLEVNFGAAYDFFTKHDQKTPN